MKKTISTILAIAGVIGFLLLIGGGIRMSMLASQSGNSVAEYYYRAMGICMIGFSFVAAGLLWGLSWMVAAWPDNQEISAALSRNYSNGPSNLGSPSQSQSTKPAVTRESSITEVPSSTRSPQETDTEVIRPKLEETKAEYSFTGLVDIDKSQLPFYDSLTSLDPTAPTVVRRLLFWLNHRETTIVWGTGRPNDSVSAYMQRPTEKTQICTIWSNGMIDVHLESLNTDVQGDITHLRKLRRLVQTLSGTAFPEDAPFELLTVPVSAVSSDEGFWNLVAVLQELMRWLKYT